jgi:hypothetical protein
VNPSLRTRDRWIEARDALVQQVRSSPVGTLRRRRNQLEYPTYPGEAAELDEVADAIRMTRQIIDAAKRALPSLGVF